jgi:hypothetical protein
MTITVGRIEKLKTPFRYQATDYDCVPTSFINALQYLFEREEIPPEVIQKVMQYSLDTINKHGEFGKGGTTGYAVEMILQWLRAYSKSNNKKFSVSCEYCYGEDVHLRQNNKIVACLNRGGVALMSVWNNERSGIAHYLLALKADEKSLYFFDPYFRKKNFTDSALHWLGVSPDAQVPNLSVDRRRLDDQQKKKYSLGIASERECCLIERV